jgi:hypothetical protein
MQKAVQMKLQQQQQQQLLGELQQKQLQKLQQQHVAPPLPMLRQRMAVLNSSTLQPASNAHAAHTDKVVPGTLELPSGSFSASASTHLHTAAESTFSTEPGMHARKAQELSITSSDDDQV